MTNLDWSHVLTNVSERKVAPSPATKLLLAGALDTTLLPEQWVNLVKDNAEQAMLLGIECLQVFVQINWTGPTTQRTTEDLLREHDVTVSADTASRVNDPQALSVDSEDAYTLASNTGFLLIARRILVDGLFAIAATDSEALPFPAIAWWAGRCVTTQQKLLEDLTSSLHDLAVAAYSRALSQLPPKTDETKDLWAMLQLEQGLMLHLFHENAKAYECFRAAQESSGLSWHLTGKLGRRLRYQTFDIAQLLIEATSATSKPEASEDGKKVPKELELHDTDLLEQINYTEDNTQGNLSVVDQCILLAYSLNFKRASPVEGLTKEEMGAFVTRVLEHPNNWLVHSMGLLLKSRLESDKGRTVERATLQLQALVDQYDDEDPKARVDLRSLYFYQLMYPARWKMQKELGTRLLSIGALRSAAELFERLQLWDNVIECYQYEEKEAKAEELVRKRLAVSPTPKLHCILGDLKQDPAEYEKAWELSNGHYARAMRSLGAHYFKNGKNDQAIECFEKALALNAIFPKTWFALGCCYMLQNNWDKALGSFTRVISLEPSDSEAWTNIASIHLQNKKKMDALRALKEAVKNTYNNWKIWENVLFVSLDLNELADAVQATNRLLEINLDRFEPELLLVLLNKYTDRDLVDTQGNSLLQHSKIVGELLTNVTSKVGDHPAIWKSVALYALSKGNLKEALDATLSAYRKEQVHGWEREESLFLNVASAAEEIAATTLEIFEAKSSTEIKNLLFTAKMTLRTVKARTKEFFEDHPKQKDLAELAERIKAAEDSLK